MIRIKRIGGPGFLTSPCTTSDMARFVAMQDEVSEVYVKGTLIDPSLKNIG